MIIALEEVIRHIESNYGEILTLSEIDNSYKDKVIAKATIGFQQSKDGSTEFYEKKVVNLEINQNGFRVLERECSNFYETIEGFLHSEVPETWIRYFETKIVEKLQE
ncbi:uncharacterized protein cubi_03731 [Cryptosporidium ubiquitum]|uniref:GSKIP domain-containing protein n=1 Tax=Cryptosporidium ubiquitum TaxID=857276 RepID=A0A1J4MQH1_9CRYT|nr:uncharacterized protein cubi_03731 [Cryptosporidium ubiquitum]OII75252.1 hypothetical protein cubi_03731 [Cryptosporidium ubiquitum]